MIDPESVHVAINYASALNAAGDSEVAKRVLEKFKNHEISSE